MQKLRLKTLRRIVLVIFLALFGAITLRWISLERWHREAMRPEPVETPTPPPGSPSATAMEAAFSTAERVTLTGSVMPSLIMSPY